MQLAKRIQYLGSQNAAQKVRPPVRKPGAWAGAIFDTSENDRITMTVSQEKWNKGKSIIESTWQELETSTDGKLDFKEMEKRRGFLVHLMMTFKFITPFLKGWHLTLDSWRPCRDREGYKMNYIQWRDLMFHSMKGLEHMAPRDMDDFLDEMYLHMKEASAPK